MQMEKTTGTSVENRDARFISQDELILNEERLVVQIDILFETIGRGTGTCQGNPLRLVSERHARA